MCGIFIEISRGNKVISRDDEILHRVKNRGPDQVQYLEMSLNNRLSAFCGAVLWMQGQTLTSQPVENEKGLFLYNGDIFDEAWDENISDTAIIMDSLCRETDLSSEESIIRVFQSLKGPFALVFYDKFNNILYFMRDRIGRSSLLFHQNNDSFIISNVLGRKYDCVEIPATHIQMINLNTYEIKCIPWDDSHESPKFMALETWVEKLKTEQSFADEEFQINECVEDFSDQDNLTSYMEKMAKNTSCKFTLMKNLLENEIIKSTVEDITRLLQKSVELRLRRQPNKCKICLKSNNFCNHCTVGVLFSGGLDCTILALLADKYLPKEQSIDLINVAFKKDDKSSYDVPDRLTGRQSLNELQKLCPSRQWNFKEVNVPKEELAKFQETVIGDLVYPRQTILDESLGSAFWFAARGQDNINTSSCRVLLLGSGADELFGGYVRHRNAFKRQSWSGLSRELLLDWKRISFRNLARDNRVICDHGRQPRMPYLDEDFTKYVLKLKPWLRCFPSEEFGVGVGDKLMLRLVAFRLGFSEVVLLPKRALQFGSRIANKKEKGSDVSKTFLVNKSDRHYIFFYYPNFMNMCS